MQNEIKRVEWFDDRFYKYIDLQGNTKYFPSVTTVLSIIRKNFLENWRGQIGNEQANQILNEAKKRGSLIHQLCADLSSGSEIKFDKEKHKQDEWLQLVRWSNWLQEVNPEILEIEKTIVHLVYGYAGTLDLVIRINKPTIINNGSEKIEIPVGVFVLDIKTGSNIDDNYSMQLISYAKAHEHEYPELKITGTILVHLNAKNKNGVKTIVTTDEVTLANDFENFLNCLVLFNRKALKIEPKIIEMPESLKWEVKKETYPSFDIIIKDDLLKKKKVRVKKTIPKIKQKEAV